MNPHHTADLPTAAARARVLGGDALALSRRAATAGVRIGTGEPRRGPRRRRGGER
ncbi:hypothetical protein I5Q34_23005 [Streptomyces sp. AV19]|uniref:hypothetical protein n=1 Tax=Streptomyces sp. AV19 TaxID=2793068 RepID=UPI0018FF08BC|nr:hypothetical protein [Streptomyces sp. AV19]MBH1937102.1 hypothetical protein [Streptomyces sp. AV19]MDG4533128.1 hypothetical protein [Streptomyces sp. AV19]